MIENNYYYNMWHGDRLVIWKVEILLLCCKCCCLSLLECLRCTFFYFDRFSGPSQSMKATSFRFVELVAIKSVTHSLLPFPNPYAYIDKTESRTIITLMVLFSCINHFCYNSSTTHRSPVTHHTSHIDNVFFRSTEHEFGP